MTAQSSINTDTNRHLINDSDTNNDTNNDDTNHTCVADAVQTVTETLDTSTTTQSDNSTLPNMADRFRKFLPVIVDVETAGFNAKTDALLEIACIPVLMDSAGMLYPGPALNAHIEPFVGANLEARALEFTGIDPNNPLRKAISEEEKPAIRRIFKALKQIRQDNNCRQCVLVGHNAHFDLTFLNALIERTNSKNHSPFHAFSVFDTVTLAALAYGQTVLARACQKAGIEFDGSEAHSALYDTQKTAELFCTIVNAYPQLPMAAEPNSNTTNTAAVDDSPKAGNQSIDEDNA